MKFIFVTIFVILAAASCVGDGSTPCHLFILSGQSNMGKLDHRASFTPVVKAAFSGDCVLVVKSTHGGAPIRRWYENTGDDVEGATGDFYDEMMGEVQKAVTGRQIKTVTFVWMQGERDAMEQNGLAYGSCLEGLIKQVQADLGRDDVNYVIGRLSDFDMDNRVYLHWTMVREAQIEVAEACNRGGWVNTDDLNDLWVEGERVNDLHYSPRGYWIFGMRLAEKSIELIRSNGGLCRLE